jgi:hypothetical protein
MIFSRPSIRKENESYTSKLVKYIPTESVVLYQTARGIILLEDSSAIITDCNTQMYFLFALVFWSILVLTPIYTYLATKNDGSLNPKFHSVIATISFTIWVMTYGDIFNCYFKDFAFYTPTFMSIILLLFTAVVPLIELLFKPNIK